MVMTAPILRNNIAKSYSQGRRREDVVTQILMLRGYQVAASSYNEDWYQDIDLWVSGHSFSIKAPKRWYPNLCLEYYSVRASGDIEPSWFLEGKAEYLALLQPDDSLTVYSFEKIRAFMSSSVIPFTGLSPELVAKNKTTLSEKGNPVAFIDCRNKNVPLSTLKTCEVSYNG